MSVGTGDSSFSPAGEVGEETGAEIAGGIEAGLRERRDDGNQNGHAEADEHWRESSRWAGLVARIGDGEHDERQDGGSQDFCGDGYVELNRGGDFGPSFPGVGFVIRSEAARRRIIFSITHGGDDASHLSAANVFVLFFFR